MFPLILTINNIVQDDTEEEEFEEEEIEPFEAPVVEYKAPVPVAQVNPIPTGDDGKPRLGRFGELLDSDRNQVLGTCLLNSEAH